MIRTVAVLSDIHGVLPALEAALGEPDLAGADLIVLTGDIAAGPQPVPVLDRLRDLGDQVRWVRGNAERDMVDIARGRPVSVEDPVTTWSAGQLRPQQVELLARLPHPLTVEVDGFGPVLFCHGTPRDDNEVVLADTRIARWQEVFADLDPAVRTVVCGHTHMPFLRTIGGRVVVNPGSVGMPYGNPGAHWALLSGSSIALRRTEFDYEAACEQIAAQSAFPTALAWAREYVRAENSDVDALVAFGPRDGRDD